MSRVFSVVKEALAWCAHRHVIFGDEGRYRCFQCGGVVGMLSRVYSEVWEYDRVGRARHVYPGRDL